MKLAAGTKLGPYEIIAPIGAGGMGEVYEARDTKLNRIVAVKILPDAFASDADRLARFKREAQVLASLNHPNIAHIHGLEDSGATHALVMEFVPGRTVAEVTASPMPVAEALTIARQIAAALEAAHEQGIVHRDLKPANVKITDDGTVKVLDFGLAKAIAGDGAAGARNAASGASPSFATMTSPAMTEMGMILGTAGYMAPEQAKGKPVDRRADIWALGVVLFEMLAGRTLYRGETVTETIAHVITQPPAWDALPAATPASVRRLLRRCLEKDPRNRLQSAGDVRIDIDECLAGPGDDAGTTLAATLAPVPAWRRWLPWAIAAILLAALGLTLRPRPPAPARVARLDVKVDNGEQLYVDENIDGPVAVISPNGEMLVYLATSGDAPHRQLFARRLDRLESTVLSGTGGAISHFFSPDSRSVAFFSEGSLRRVSISGGSPAPIVAASDGRGGTWGSDDTIVYTPSISTGLMRVPAGGGTAPVEVTRLAPNERTHRWPSFLPNGKAVLFMCQLHNAAYDDGTIEAVRLDTGERKVLVRGGTSPLYLTSGHLVYTRQNTVYAVAFDPDRLEVRGEPQVVLTGVTSAGIGTGSASGNGATQITLAFDGTAVYLTGEARDDSGLRLAILDRSGKQVYEYSERAAFRDPRFDPDGRRVALRAADATREQVHVLDLARGTLTKMTFDGNVSGLPIWSRDGQQIAYFSDRGGKGLEVYLIRTDGTGDVKAVTSGGQTRVASSFSPDQARLAVSDLSPQTNWDVTVVSLADGKMTPFVNTPAVELLPAFSPDGRWIAYQAADGSAPMEVFVRAYPDGSGRRQVSAGGGLGAVWTKGGRELIYVNETPTGVTFMSVDVMASTGALTLGKPQKLFDVANAKPPNAGWYDVAADGNRFVVLLPVGEVVRTGRTHFTLVFNFQDDVRRLVAREPK